MAKPRIFVSSTYYDLKHIRSSLELFIDSVGYDPVLSEKGDIAYAFDQALDESCYREAASADILVLVVGGRYGAEVSADRKKPDKSFFDRYDSITKKEFDAAYSADVPIYILIESGVYAEYQTYLKNRDSTSIRYAHVESVNVFRLIEDILSKPKNNPIFPFERSSEIEGWLREQWAGLFRELLRKKSQQQQLSALSFQINDLRAVSETLKNYMEAVLTGSGPTESVKIIEDEERKLLEARRIKQVEVNGFWMFLRHEKGIAPETALSLISDSTSFDDFAQRVLKLEIDDDKKKEIIRTTFDFEAARKDFNEARTRLDKSPLPLEMSDHSDTFPTRRVRRKKVEPKAS